MRKLSILIILVVLLTGCSAKNGIVLEEVEVGIEQVESVEAWGQELDKPTNEMEHSWVDEKIFLDFFKKYFSLSLDQRLLLNQDPVGLVETEKVDYQEGMRVLKEVLFPYLSETALASLQSDYKGTKTHLPKLLEINNYITLESAEVESTQIISARPFGENIIYEVEVATRETVIDIIEANKRYDWDEKKKYYVEKENIKKERSVERKKAFETAYNIEESLKDSYLFLQETPDDKEDEMRLVHRYWVEVIPGDGLVIESIEEASPFIMQDAYRQKASSNQYVTRIAYEVDEAEKNRIKEVLLTLFSWPSSFFEHYENMMKQDYQSVRDFFGKLGMQEQMLLPKEHYQNAYHSNINPYKDNIQKINTTLEHIKIEPSVSGTKKQHRYNVTIPAQTLQKDNQVAYYEYRYLVGFEEKKIEFIHFLEMKRVLLEEYERLTIE